MIRTVIIEDEHGSRESLKAILKEFFEDIELVGEAADIKTGIKTIKTKKPDIVFMDIRLPDGDSFEILDAFTDPNFEVIFITAYSDYLQKAFDYFSFQYLSKPVDIEKLEKTMDRYRSRKENVFSKEKLKSLKTLLTGNSEFLVIPHSDGIKMMKLSDIVRLEASGSYTTVYMMDGSTFLSSKGIGGYQTQLEATNFYRTHKSHLINVSYIDDVSYSEGITLKNGDRVPLSQRAKKDFLEYISNMNG